MPTKPRRYVILEHQGKVFARELVPGEARPHVQLKALAHVTAPSPGIAMVRYCHGDATPDVQYLDR